MLSTAYVQAMETSPKFRPSLIRQWRLYRGLSLRQLANAAGIEKSNLSKIERGLLPYGQEKLEKIAHALATDAASLLAREPSNSAAFWALWENASPRERAQIESVAKALLAAHPDH